MSDFIGSLKRLLSDITNGTIKLGNFYKTENLPSEQGEFVIVDFVLGDFGDGFIVLSEDLAKALGNEMLRVFQLTVDNLNDDLVLSTIGEAINQSVNGAVQENAEQFGMIPSVSVGAAQVVTTEALKEKVNGLSFIEVEGGLWFCVPNKLSSVLLKGYSDVSERAETGPLEIEKTSPLTVQENGVEDVTFPQLRPEDDIQPLPRNLELLLDVKVNVSVELGRSRVSIKDLLSLGSGSIITLDKLAGEPVDILVNGKPIAKGEVVVIDEAFGVRILDIIAPKERLKAEI